jgi:hypothetical protein
MLVLWNAKYSFWAGENEPAFAKESSPQSDISDFMDSTCELCKGQVKIIACIEDPAVIERILAHLKSKAPSAELALVPEGRGPPQARFLD